MDLREPREEFEKFVRDTFICDENSFNRDHDGWYYSVVHHNYAISDFASVQMLWRTWQAAQNQIVRPS